MNRISRRDWLKVACSSAVAGGTLFGHGCAHLGHARTPNILLITLDTTRTDRLSCFGYERTTSPNLDRLAAESVFYERAIAPSSWTLPSHASLFTGKMVSSHGAQFDPKGPLVLGRAINAPEGWDQYRARGLNPNEQTMAMLLADRGYACGAVVAGPWMKKVFGLDRGFAYYDDDEITSQAGRLAPSVTLSGLEWVKSLDGKPFFLFLNYFDPHKPYVLPEVDARRFLPDGADLTAPEFTSDLYDAEIHYMDRYIGVLLDELRYRGLYDELMIVVTADHGELLGEHGRTGHGETLYQEEIHIPLFIKYPKSDGKSAERLQHWVHLTDVFPTLLRRLDIAVPEDTQGTALDSVTHPILSEAFVLPLPFVEYQGNWRTLIEGSHKVVWHSEGDHRLYNLDLDPHEQTDVFAQEQARGEEMLSTLNAYVEALPKPAISDGEQLIDDDTLETLKSFGYL